MASESENLPDLEPSESGAGEATGWSLRFAPAPAAAGAEAIRSFDPALPWGPGSSDGGPLDPQVRVDVNRPRLYIDEGGGPRFEEVPMTPPDGGSAAPRGAPSGLSCTELSAMADQSLVTSPNHFWQNWPKTHAFLTSLMCFPTSLAEVGAAVRLAERSRLPVRAIGGGWSFSDAALPGSVTTPRPDVSTADLLARWHPQAQGFRPTGPSTAIIDSTDSTLIGWDDSNRSAPALAVPGAAVLEGRLAGAQPKPVCLINTRSLTSTLQETLSGLLSDTAAERVAEGDTHYFHAEAGITIADLGPLLAAQSPPLVLEATGGNPGATIAGTLSTGTRRRRVEHPAARRPGQGRAPRRPRRAAVVDRGRRPHRRPRRPDRPLPLRG